MNDVEKIQKAKDIFERAIIGDAGYGVLTVESLGDTIRTGIVAKLPRQTLLNALTTAMIHVIRSKTPDVRDEDIVVEATLALVSMLAGGEKPVELNDVPEGK